MVGMGKECKKQLKLATISNHDLGRALPAAASFSLHGIHHIQSVYHFPEHNVLAIKPVQGETSSFSTNIKWKSPKHFYILKNLQCNGKVPKMLKYANINLKEAIYQVVSAVQMKNWEPLVFAPALAMDRVPFPPCFRVKFSSSNLLPQMDFPPVPLWLVKSPPYITRARHQ